MPNGYIHGYDTSHWNTHVNGLYRPTDHRIARANGFRFAWYKGADGTYIYPEAYTEYENMLSAQIYPGIYTWFYSSKYYSAQKQVDAWWNAFKDYLGYLPLMPDFETYTKKNVILDAPNCAELKELRWRWQDKSGKDFIAYSSPEYIKGYGGPTRTDPSFSTLENMMARYNSMDKPVWVNPPVDIPPFPPCTFWQGSSVSDVNLIGAYVDDPYAKTTFDEDRFMLGGEAEFTNWLKSHNIPLFDEIPVDPPIDPPVEPPVIGEPDMTITIGTVLSYGLNSRSTPMVSPTNIVKRGLLTKGDLVSCDKKNGEWYRLVSARRNGTNIVIPSSPTGEVWICFKTTTDLVRKEWDIDVAPETDVTLSLDLAGAKVGTTGYTPERLEGSTVHYKKDS